MVQVQLTMIFIHISKCLGIISSWALMVLDAYIASYSYRSHDKISPYKIICGQLTGNTCITFGSLATDLFFDLHTYIRQHKVTSYIHT